MIRLGINLDHICTLRNARGEFYPDPIQAAALAEIGGADNITCHLREDRRHIKDEDVRRFSRSLNIPLNLEIAATPEMIEMALEVKPHAVTLVPEKRQELTTEGGLNLRADHKILKSYVDKLRTNHILVSLFVEPDLEDMRLCSELGADAVELHTGNFCHHLLKARRSKDQWQALEPLREAAVYANDKSLQVHVGHGLNYQNAHWIQALPFCEEANIGHAVIARAVFTGLTNAVQEMKSLLNNPAFHPEIKHAR